MIESKQLQKTHLVLAVDDQEINRDALGAILEDDYEVIYAENGKEALEQIREHLDRLSIILLDLVMPEMDGFAVLEYLRGDERMKQIPVIVLTADKNAELTALQHGAADFITKPFNLPEVILARVARIIELSEGRQLISSAERDRLTMLYSRSFFLEYANRIFQYHPDMHMDAVEMNIEQFHLVNALHGHSSGDEVLRLIGSEIRSFLAETEGIASRWEADSFDMYCAHRQDYPEVLRRFQQKVDSVFRDIKIRLRMGVAPWKEGLKPTAAFDMARTACGMMRGNYQKPLMIYDTAMHEREMLNQRLLNDLNAAAEGRQLTVFYQPKYDIKCNPPRLSSAEALVRWKHPDLGMISPGLFIPLLEDKGLIGVVDQFVWREAAAQVAAWRDKYRYTLPVSVNVSRSDMFEPGLEDRLLAIVTENGLDIKMLKLEVTESAYTDSASQMLAVIRCLQETGFEIEMDDFGSGYSSLNMLSEMPFDVLKMDMKFVRNIENNQTDYHLVKLILDIAKYLQVKVVAEGVETEGQLKLLKDAGCDLVQGYYFSRPLPPEDFEKLIQQELAAERGAS